MFASFMGCSVCMNLAVGEKQHFDKALIHFSFHPLVSSKFLVLNKSEFQHSYLSYFAIKWCQIFCFGVCISQLCKIYSLILRNNYTINSFQIAFDTNNTGNLLIKLVAKMMNKFQQHLKLFSIKECKFGLHVLSFSNDNGAIKLQFVFTT